MADFEFSCNWDLYSTVMQSYSTTGLWQGEGKPRRFYKPLNSELDNIKADALRKEAEQRAQALHKERKRKRMMKTIGTLINIAIAGAIALVILKAVGVLP